MCYHQSDDHPSLLQHRRRLYGCPPRYAGCRSDCHDRRRRRERHVAGHFAELAELTRRFAQALRDLGIDAGERVLIRLPNCLAYPFVFLGTMKRGAIPVPSSIMLTAEEVGYLLDDAGTSVLVTDRRSWEFLGGQIGNARGLRHVILVKLSSHERTPSGLGLTGQTGPTRSEPNPARHARPGRAARCRRLLGPPHPTRADDPAYLVYTSGTTAFPKGVLHAHRALLGRRPAMEAWFDFQATTACCIPASSTGPTCSARR